MTDVSRAVGDLYLVFRIVNATPMMEFGRDTVKEGSNIQEVKEGPNIQEVKARSKIHEDLSKRFDEIINYPIEPQNVLCTALEVLWKHQPSWQELYERSRGHDSPADGLFYLQVDVDNIRLGLKELYQTWSEYEARMSCGPPKQLPNMAKICLILGGMKKQGLLEKFLESGFDDANLPLDKDRIAQVLQSDSVRYTDRFHAEQYRAQHRPWINGIHLSVYDQEPLPLRKLQFIGSGAYASVHAAEDVLSGAPFALKIQHAKPEYLDESREHLMTEIDKLKRLSHRHIVNYLKSYERAGEIGILLNPLASMNLARLMVIYRKNLINPDLGCEDRIWLAPFMLKAFGCLSRALVYIHHSNIRHKDVKPSNILCLFEGLENGQSGGPRFYWADFGLAYDFKDAGNSKTRSTDCYSPRYAAPEFQKSRSMANAGGLGISNTDLVSVNQGKRIIPQRISSDTGEHGRAADIFSLGCVYLELLQCLVEEEFPLIGPKPFFANHITELQGWMTQKGSRFPKLKSLFSLTSSMISLDPEHRPSIETVVARLRDEQCYEGSRANFCDECWKEVKDEGPNRSLPGSLVTGHKASPNLPSSPTSTPRTLARKVFPSSSKVPQSGFMRSRTT